MLVQYETRYWDEEMHEDAIERGVVTGTDWNDIVNKLEAYYGGSNIVTFTLTPLEDPICESDLVDMWK